MATRAFLAVDLNERILDALTEVREKIDDAQARIRWVARRNLHVTVLFLGDVGDDLLAEVCARAENVASKVAPFEFHVERIKCVPDSGPLRMVWAEIEDLQGGLESLHDAVKTELAGMGLHEDRRPFKAHLTLARVKSIPDWSAFRNAASAYADADFGSHLAGDLALYGSELTPSGPVYRELSRSVLAGDS